MLNDKNDNKKVLAITSREEDFARWYTDIVIKAELADYSTVKGCIVYRPLGYAIWEMIQAAFDKMIKDTGHHNVYMPMLIPESLLQKEAEHVEGFAPEVAWVTHGGHEKLAERLCIRPTSETLFCDHYAKVIQSHRDLPKLYNQWCSVCRWEKTTRPFLRGSEFLWQEGHTAHATYDEAQTETLMILDFYEDVCRDFLAIPVIKGQKTDRERFAGAKATYTIESLMNDGKSLQSGTSHNFSDGFARAFDIKFTDKNNEIQYVYQTSWGMSTRTIGALIMVHGDDNGLVLPPKVAPTQVVIIPVASHKEGVMEQCVRLKSQLSSKFRVVLDDSDKSPGWKFAEHEMKGVPLRLELGPKDIESGQVTLVRRDNSEKCTVALDEVSSAIEKLLDKIQSDMLQRAIEHKTANTRVANTYEELAAIAEQHAGFIKAMWCGSGECELNIKNDLGVTARCIPFEQEQLGSKCIACDEAAKQLVIWGKSY
ncbi:MAG: proline--tRNA ligase [Defluviitaleaceae bacterium]|nr:proline--tRNA ligase [Defluviitaleaceae bacterium]